MTKIILCFLALLTINVARSQVNLDEDFLILYGLNSTQGKYVLCVNFKPSEKSKDSFTVIGDTFAVESRGQVSVITMSNAHVLHTKFGPSPTNEVAQSKMWTEKYTIAFPEHTKLVFNNSVVELQNWRNNPAVEKNIKIYEGEDALRQLKKMGMEPPPDMDTNWAVGHPTQKAPP